MVEPKGEKPKAAGEHRAARESAAPAPAESRVAASLRSARLAAGIDLHKAAESLRIRYPYLEAIEAGRFGELPGPTYALGFVRAYAEFLGLDGKQMVRQFKEEGQAVSRRLTLIFPEPLQEGRFPGGAILFIAVVLAAAVYGGWYFWAHRQAGPAAEVPSVPSNLAKLVTTNPQTPQKNAVSVPTPGPRSEPGAASAPVAAATDTSQAAPAAQKEPSGAASGAPTVAAVSPPAAAPPVSSQASSATSTAPGSTPEANPTEAATPGEPTSPAVAAAPAETSPATTAEPAGAPMPEQVTVLRPTEPTARGNANADSRITLNAKLDSWVEVRDASGKVLSSRLMRAGESYRLPNQPGLVLVTGNAGGLEIMVDGKPTPPLGPVGVVRRNIRLDPDRLAAGIRSTQ